MHVLFLSNGVFNVRYTCMLKEFCKFVEIVPNFHSSFDYKLDKKIKIYMFKARILPQIFSLLSHLKIHQERLYICYIILTILLFFLIIRYVKFGVLYKSS